MAVAPLTNPPPTFELKSAALMLVAVVLKTTDIELLTQAFAERFGDAPGLFEQDPVAIDLGSVRDRSESIDFEALLELLRSHGMLPIAARSGSPAQMEAALAAGLSEAHASAPPARAEPRAAEKPAESAPEAPEPPEATIEARAVVLDIPPAPRMALIVDKPLRSGQKVYAKGADLIVLALVSHGAEVIADGNIHVYAPLRGRALAGALGDTSARIFTTCMEPQLLSIAGIYRTTETELPASVLGKPAQVRLDGEKLVVEPLKY
ncbi:MAG: septum site-determining protein MinC [Burkholderiaceae bacterium]